MSARAPFFPPGARPESRAAGDQQESNAESSTFRQDALTDIPSKERNTNDTDNKSPTENDIKDTQYKPLNVNGLIRSRTHSKPPQRILINEGNISRPGTADPDAFSAHNPIIAAPTPFKASRMAPHLLMNMSNAAVSSSSASTFNFRAPAAPSTYSHGENNTHIPTETHSSSHGTDASVQIRLANGISSGRNVAGCIPDDKNVDDSIHGFTTQQITSGKRRKGETETSGQTDQHQKHLKRRKGENSLRVENSGSELSISRGTNLASNHRQGHRHSRDVAENHAYNGVSNSFAYEDAETVNVEQNFVEYGGAFDRLLGRDINAYAEEHLVEKYERALKRWSECSLEEWYAGAEEIMSKYSKILELVKERMNAKLAMYASLDKKIEQREVLLAEREEMLSSVQTQFVKESESVLGGSLGI